LVFFFLPPPPPPMEEALKKKTSLQYQSNQVPNAVHAIYTNVLITQNYIKIWLHRPDGASCKMPAHSADGTGPKPWPNPTRHQSRNLYMQASAQTAEMGSAHSRRHPKGNRACTMNIWIDFLIRLTIVLSVGHFEHNVKNILILKDNFNIHTTYTHRVT